jgi:hypothetical protein
MCVDCKASPTAAHIKAPVVCLQVGSYHSLLAHAVCCKTSYHHAWEQQLFREPSQCLQAAVGLFVSLSSFRSIDAALGALLVYRLKDGIVHSRYRVYAFCKIAYSDMP